MIRDFKKWVLVKLGSDKKTLHGYGFHNWVVYKTIKREKHYKCTMCKDRKTVK